MLLYICERNKARTSEAKMLSKTMYKTVLQQTYERYVLWARDERDLAEKHRRLGNIVAAETFTRRANDFAKQATEAMQDIARMNETK